MDTTEKFPILRYRGGYKYQLARRYVCDTGVRPRNHIRTEYIELTIGGRLALESGYAWDGPSGPTIDTPSFMRASAEHDAFYQLMRLGLLDQDTYRKPADRRLRAVCLEDGMWRVRAWWVYRGVRLGGGPSASRAAKREIMTAPGRPVVC